MSGLVYCSPFSRGSTICCWAALLSSYKNSLTGDSCRHTGGDTQNVVPFGQTKRCSPYAYNYLRHPFLRNLVPSSNIGIWKKNQTKSKIRGLQCNYSVPGMYVTLLSPWNHEQSWNTSWLSHAGYHLKLYPFLLPLSWLRVLFGSDRTLGYCFDCKQIRCTFSFWHQSWQSAFDSNARRSFENSNEMFYPTRAWSTVLLKAILVINAA